MTVWEAYDVLGLEPAASAEEVRKTYKNLLKKYHPDNNVNDSPQSEKECRQRFERVKEAYDTIIAKRRRMEIFIREKHSIRIFSIKDPKSLIQKKNMVMIRDRKRNGINMQKK